MTAGGEMRRVTGPERMVAVIGTGEPDETLEDAAEAIGAGLAKAGVTVVCGGLAGVMAAACRGAKAHGGHTVGILPGRDPAAANPWVDVAIPTGFGEARNALVVRSAEAVIAVGGGYGTLSEIALALKAGTRVIGLDTWEISGVEMADSPDDAVERLTLGLEGRTP
ncbi:MAG: TIGR00725 family protein [Egibacteraceae bacterium]